MKFLIVPKQTWEPAVQIRIRLKKSSSHLSLQKTKLVLLIESEEMKVGGDTETVLVLAVDTVLGENSWK